MAKAYCQLTVRISPEAMAALDRISPPREKGQTVERLILAAACQPQGKVVQSPQS